MSKFFSGKELLDRWSIRDFELFEYVSTGKLRPYDKFGRLLPHPYLLSNARLQELKGQLKHHESILEIADAYKIPHDHPQRQSLEASIASNKQTALEATKWLKAELSESKAASSEPVGWKGSDLPQDMQKAEDLIEILANSLYHREDVSNVEQERAQEQRKRAIDDRGIKRRYNKLRRSQIHRLNCRNAAMKLWNEDPSITIADMIDRQELINACDKKLYQEKTIRNWIKDLCPNRAPGRRPA